MGGPGNVPCSATYQEHNFGHACFPQRLNGSIDLPGPTHSNDFKQHIIECQAMFNKNLLTDLWPARKLK